MSRGFFFIYEINFKVFSGHLKQKSSVALQVTGCRSIVAAASGCHQNCLEAMSCVKTIEVIFEGKSMLQNILCFVTKNPISFCQTNLKLQEITF